MQKTYERLAFAVQNGRKREKITQAKLAEKLHMSIRTIQDIENQKSNPKFETIILICKELNISLDAVIFPETTNTYLSKTIIDFFKNKNDNLSKKYISICEYIQELNKIDKQKELRRTIETQLFFNYICKVVLRH